MKYMIRSFLLIALLMPAQLLAKESHLVRLQRLIDEHTVVVQNKVVNSWAQPSVSAAKLSSVVEVAVTMKGKVTAARVVSSSGNPDFDRSVEEAITLSSPLPVAADPEVMDQFRTLQFEFRFGVFDSTGAVPLVNSTLDYSNYVHVKSPIYIDK